MEEDKQLKKLNTLMEMIDDDKAKSEDVEQVFGVLIEIIKQAKDYLEQKMASDKGEMTQAHKSMYSEMEEMESRMKGMHDKMCEKQAVDNSSIKKQLKEEVKRLEDMIPAPADFSEIERKVSELEKTIPKIPEELTADQIADKLNTLEEAVDIETIRGLKKKLEDLEKKWTSRPIFGGGGLSLGAIDMHFPPKYTPTGDVNGVNTDFILNHIPSPASSLDVYLNGQLQDLTNDYTVSGTTVSFVSAPLTGNKVRVKHRI
jgi:hypothetical protein